MSAPDRVAELAARWAAARRAAAVSVPTLVVPVTARAPVELVQVLAATLPDNEPPVVKFGKIHYGLPATLSACKLTMISDVGTNGSLAIGEVTCGLCRARTAKIAPTPTIALAPPPVEVLPSDPVEEEAAVAAPTPLPPAPASRRPAGPPPTTPAPAPSSSFRGVTPSDGGWRAAVAFNGAVIAVGTFTKPEEAARAYDVKALELKGPDAMVNFETSRGSIDPLPDEPVDAPKRHVPGRLPRIADFSARLNERGREQREAARLAQGTYELEPVEEIDEVEDAAEDEDTIPEGDEDTTADTSPWSVTTLTRDQLRSRRQRTVRPRTISVKNTTKRELEIGRELYPETEYDRPATRGECIDGERPCPMVSCAHHLYLDVSEETGSIKLNFPDLEVWEMNTSCALDIADRGGMTLDNTGAIMNMTRERVRQIENKALATLKRRRNATLMEIVSEKLVVNRRLPMLATAPLPRLLLNVPRPDSMSLPLAPIAAPVVTPAAVAKVPEPTCFAPADDPPVVARPPFAPGATVELAFRSPLLGVPLEVIDVRSDEDASSGWSVLVNVPIPYRPIAEGWADAALFRTSSRPLRRPIALPASTSPTASVVDDVEHLLATAAACSEGIAPGAARVFLNAIEAARDQGGIHLGLLVVLAGAVALREESRLDPAHLGTRLSALLLWTVLRRAGSLLRASVAVPWVRPIAVEDPIVVEPVAVTKVATVKIAALAPINASPVAVMEDEYDEVTIVERVPVVPGAYDPFKRPLKPPMKIARSLEE